MAMRTYQFLILGGAQEAAAAAGGILTALGTGGAVTASVLPPEKEAAGEYTQKTEITVLVDAEEGEHGGSQEEELQGWLSAAGIKRKDVTIIDMRADSPKDPPASPPSETVTKPT